jgi:iron complex transport system ATP-binding protein
MFADRMAFLVAGRLAAIGTPVEVMQQDLLEAAYGCQITLNRAPVSGPWLLPQSCR